MSASEKRDSVISLLADLVAIPSMNPMGRARTGAEYSEGKLAEYVADYLRKNRVDVVLDEVAPGRPNVVGKIDVSAPTTVMLEAHLDTVHADSMQIPPFNPEVKEGKLYGRGSCDAKASLAAFLYAAVTLLKWPRSLRHNVVLAAVIDEEYRFSGAQRLIEKGVDADYAIAGEPTRLRIVRAHKGVTRWKIVTKGRAAHSAYPERGENAIYSMAQVLQRLEAHAEDLLVAKHHPLLGSPTLNVGVIEGGQAVNMVPDRCWIDVDRRTLPDETMEGILGPLRDMLAEVGGTTVEPPYLAAAGMEVPDNATVVRLLADAIREETGDVIIEGAHYATDAGLYNRAGIPTVVFGPGDIAQAHASIEFMELMQLQQATAIIKRILTT
jgi:acetylornithine deacetylase/succinyl-diaminopimelate desuccinylase family protein